MTQSFVDLSILSEKLDTEHTNGQFNRQPSEGSPKGLCDAARADHDLERENIGAYGLRLHGLSEALRLLRPCAPDQLTLDVTVHHSDEQVTQHHLGDDEARYRLQTGGCIFIDRATAHARYLFPIHRTLPSAEELVHPFLFAAAATLNLWHDRLVFHAGAFVHDGGAWVLAGSKAAGKSSTLGWLAAQGYTIITDDLVVIDDGDVLAGPACIDLRPDAAKELGIGKDIGVVGTRERWRHLTGGAPARVPLRGWLFPQWHSHISISRIPVAERLRRLFASQAIVAPPSRPDAMIALSATPMYRFARPRQWLTAQRSIEQLLTIIRT